MSTVVASTVVRVYSRRLYCILGERVPVPVRKGTASVLRSGGDDAKLLVVGAALAGGDGTSLVLMMGHWTSPL